MTYCWAETSCCRDVIQTDTDKLHTYIGSAQSNLADSNTEESVVELCDYYT